MRTYKNEQAGRSMVEMLGVLAIIGVLSVAGIAGYSKAMAKFKLSKTTDQVSMIVANIRTLFSGQRNYNGMQDGNATIISYGVVPGEMVNGDSITHAFAGPVTFGTEKINEVEHLAFTLEFDGLNRETCMSLATADWGSDSSSGLVSMSIGGGEAQSGGALPVSLSVAAAGCNCGSDTTCKVKWTYL